MKNKIYLLKKNREFIIGNKFAYFILLYFLLFKIIYSENIQVDFQDVFDQHNVPRLIISVEDGSIVMANQGAVDFYGYELEEILKMNIKDINVLSKEDVEKEWKSASTNEKNRFRFPHKLADGKIKNVEVFSYPINYGNEKYLYSVIIDISNEIEAIKNLEQQRKVIMFLASSSIFLSAFSIILMYKLKEKYKKIATHDPLTGLYSREYLKSLNQEMSYEKSSVVMVDINDFKKINDTYGHLVGDKVLKKVAVILVNNLREKDIVIRYGGDEFLLVLFDICEDKALEILERIACKLLESSEFEFMISLSYGVALWSKSVNIEEIIKFADEKMYKMKKKEVYCKLGGDKIER